jgi:hypothetical protein
VIHEDPNLVRLPPVKKPPKRPRAKTAPKNAHTEFRRFYDVQERDCVVG